MFMPKHKHICSVVGFLARPKAIGGGGLKITEAKTEAQFSVDRSEEPSD